MQSRVDEFVTKSRADGFRLNKSKCKQLRISFTKPENTLEPVTINNTNIEWTLNVSNSPNRPRVYMRLCKHGKSPLLPTWLIAVIPVEAAAKASLFYSHNQTRPMGQYNGKWRISLVYVPKPVVAKCDNSYLPDFLCGRWSFGVVLYEIFTMGRYFVNSALLFVWNLAPVVQRVDSIIHWINHFII